MLDTLRIILCTENGEIMLLENSGEFISFISHSPMNGFKIQCIIPYSKGFLIGGESGEILIYEKSEDVRHPYVKRKSIVIKMDPNQTITYSNYPIMSMVLQ